MIVEPADVGARGCDSLVLSQGGTPAQMAALKASGVDFFVGYLGSITPARLLTILAAGLAFMPVTFGGEYEDGALDEIAQLTTLGIPGPCSVWLDMEGLKAYHTDAAKLISMINTWADGIEDAGWMPCLYVGAPQPLTSSELHALHVVRYWKGQGRCVDRFNALAEPTNGWCMTQMWPSIARFAPMAMVDANMIGADYKSRVPSWVR